MLLRPREKILLSWLLTWADLLLGHAPSHTYTEQPQQRWISCDTLQTHIIVAVDGACGPVDHLHVMHA
jgi:hypothetical protein